MNVQLFQLLTSSIAGSGALWIAYRVFLFNRPGHRLARGFLLAAMLLPVLAPALQWLLPTSSSELRLEYTLPGQVVAGATGSGNAIPFRFPLLAIYGAVCALLIMRQAVGLVRLRVALRRSPRHRRLGVTIHTATGFGPGSVGSVVFFPGDAMQPEILAHELGHIRLGHRFDLLFANLLCCFFWVNPFFWIIRRDLRLVHEFEADSFAATQGAAAEPYARLLLTQSFGVSAGALSHSFFKILDDEALRVVKAMPAWNPGVQQGKKVSVFFTLPVTFKLDDGDFSISPSSKLPDSVSRHVIIAENARLIHR